MSVPEERRDSVLSSLERVLDYFVNASLLALPVSLVIFWKDVSFLDYVLVVLCLWIALPFVEHYYAWFRSDWKVEDKD